MDLPERWVPLNPVVYQQNLAINFKWQQLSLLTWQYLGGKPATSWQLFHTLPFSDAKTMLFGLKKTSKSFIFRHPKHVFVFLLVLPPFAAPRARPSPAIPQLPEAKRYRPEIYARSSSPKKW
jgi:hypothetical protein